MRVIATGHNRDHGRGLESNRCTRRFVKKAVQFDAGNHTIHSPRITLKALKSSTLLTWILEDTLWYPVHSSADRNSQVPHTQEGATT